MSRSAWFVSSLFFWVFLAGMEVTGALVVNVFPPPLGKGSMPTAMDVYYLVVAVSLYALLSIPTALILFGTETLFSRLKEKARISFMDLNRMDYYLFFGCGLLCFKWISNCMPYLIDGDHLPNTPYLLMLPLLGLYLGVSSFSTKTAGYYRMQWLIIFAGTFFLSKTAYDIFIASSLGVAVKCCLLALFVSGTLFLARIFHALLRRILMERVKPRLTHALLCGILLTGGLIFTSNALFLKEPAPASFPQPLGSQNGGSHLTKNVVIVLVDCLRADHLGCYGYERQVSPFIDRVAQAGTLFTNCIAPSSWTIPSVVSLFTGVYPQQHGVNEFGSIIPGNLVSIQELMEKQGVRTAAFITNDYLRPHIGYAKGFSHYADHYLDPALKDYVSSRLFFLNALLHFKNEIFYPYSVDPGGTKWWSIGFPPFNHHKRSAERVTDDALHWIDSHRDKAFYIYLHYMDVHSPYDAIWYPLFDEDVYAAQDAKEKLINTYDGRITYVDQQIKRFWEALARMHILENTIFIITADHGEELYDHEGIGHCTTLYDELIRVPLIINNTFPAGVRRKVEQQVQLIDLPVTILDLLGIELPEQMRGRSLVPLLESTPPLSEPAYALSYTTRGRKSLKTEEGKALWERKVWDQGGVLTSLRKDGRWKIVRGEDGHAELFDLHKDKGEHNNVKDREEAVFEDLEKKLMETLSALQRITPRKEKLELSPDTRNKLRALGYL